MEDRWCDSDDLLQDYYDFVRSKALRDVFYNQEHIVYMVNELGKGRNPKFKDDAIDKIYEIVCGAIDDMVLHITMDIIKSIHENAVDMPESVADEYNFYFGLEEGDEGFAHSVDQQSRKKYLRFAFHYYII